LINLKSIISYFFVYAFIYHCSGQELIGDKNEFYEVKYEINTLSGVT